MNDTTIELENNIVKYQFEIKEQINDALLITVITDNNVDLPTGKITLKTLRKQYSVTHISTEYKHSKYILTFTNSYYTDLYTQGIWFFHNRTYTYILQKIFSNNIDVDINITVHTFIAQNETNFNILRRICALTNMYFICTTKIYVRPIKQLSVHTIQTFVIVKYSKLLHAPSYQNYIYNVQNPEQATQPFMYNKWHIYNTVVPFDTPDQMCMLPTETIQGQIDVIHPIALFNVIEYNKTKFYVTECIISNTGCTFVANSILPLITFTKIKLPLQRAIVKDSTIHDGKIAVNFLYDVHKTDIPIIVVQAAAGKNGTHLIPSVGTEVIVDFINNTDPVIVGCLYNTAHTVKLPVDSYGVMMDADSEQMQQMYMNNEQIKIECNNIYTNVKNNKQLTIHHGDYKIDIQEGDLTIHTAKQTILLADDTITLKAKQIKIDTQHMIINTDRFELNSDRIATSATQLKIESTECNMDYNKLNINTNNMLVQATSANVIGTAKLQLTSNVLIDVQANLIKNNATAAIQLNSNGAINVNATAINIKSTATLMLAAIAVIIQVSGVCTITGFTAIPNGLMRIGCPT